MYVKKVFLKFNVLGVTNIRVKGQSSSAEADSRLTQHRIKLRRQKPITSCFYFLQCSPAITANHVILPQFFLFAVFTAYFSHLISSLINV